MFKKSCGTMICIVLLVLTALTIMLIAGGCSCNEEVVSPIPTTVPRNEATPEPATEEPLTEEPSAEPTATPEPEAVNNEMPPHDGSVAAITFGTYGVATDGSVRYMGRSVTGQCYINDWQDVVQLVANDSTTAALLSDGSLLFTGESAEELAEATADWSDQGVVSIALGGSHIVGLKSDGTVVAFGDDRSGQCRVQDWERVTAVYAGSNFTVGVTDEYGVGLYDTLHRNVSAALPEDFIIQGAAVAEDHIALLNAEGRVYTMPLAQPNNSSREDGRSGTRDGLTELDWTNVVKVFAAEGATYGIDANGRLLADSDVIDSGFTAGEGITDVYTLSASAEHVVVLHNDGTAEGFGENDDLQCKVENWRLLPYVTENGYMLGYKEGDMVGDELYRTGLELTLGDPTETEVEKATAVLLGDLNGDGAIDEADYSAMTAHINGSRPLEGAYLRAANIISDSSRPDAVDIVDKDALRRHLDGKCPIDQYAKTDMYTTKLANAKRVNTDALGYITLPGTNIDYPIMYGDNWYYHSRGLDGSNLERGSIYTYWGTPNKNTVITGHNARTSGTMLHQLHYIQDNYARNYNVYANRVWCLNLYGTTGYWEVWSMYEEGAFSNPDNSSLVYNTCFPSTMSVMSDAQIEAWIQYQQKKSQLNYTVNVTTEDTFVTVVTCGDTHYASEQGSRLYFFLRLVSGN